MKEIKYVVTDAMGIHARPAGLLVKVAAGFECSIKIRKEEKEADAKRIMGVMGLGVKQGNEITITLVGPDEEQATEAMKVFLKENL